MLLKELQSKTPETHVHYEQITQALTTTGEIANMINRAKKEAENAQRIFEIQSSCVQKDLKLLESHRRYQKEGDLSFQIETKKYENGHVFFFNDSILLTVLLSTNKYQIFGFVDLTKDSLITNLLDDSVHNVFPISVSKDQKSFPVVLLCKDLIQKNDFLNLLQDNVGNFNKRKSSFLSSSENIENNEMN